MEYWQGILANAMTVSLQNQFLYINVAMSRKQNQTLYNMHMDLLSLTTGSIRVVFNWVSKVISELLWFCITSLRDWLKVLVPLFQPIRSETKTNCGSCVHIFPCFVSATCNYFEFWLVYWFISPSFLIGQSNYFGFGFTTLVWRLGLGLGTLVRPNFFNSSSC